MDRASPKAGTREYHPGASLLPLFFWGILTTGGALLALDTASHRSSTSPAGFLAAGIAVLGFLFGPVAFVAHLLRACLVTVVVDPDRGVVLSGGRTIAWRDLESVEERPAAFQGLLRPNPILFFLTAGSMAILYWVVLPACALFTPWHRRVILRLRDGSVVRLRDLARADEFVREVSSRIPGHGPPSRGP
jgi:hypothetical protein